MNSTLSNDISLILFFETFAATTIPFEAKTFSSFDFIFKIFFRFEGAIILPFMNK